MKLQKLLDIYWDIHNGVESTAIEIVREIELHSKISDFVYRTKTDDILLYPVHLFWEPAPSYVSALTVLGALKRKEDISVDSWWIEHKEQSPIDKSPEALKFHVLALCAAIRNSFIGAKFIYTCGSCYQFYLILKEVFPEAVAYVNGDHFITRIGDRYYDINGEYKDAEGFLPATEIFRPNTLDVFRDVRFSLPDSFPEILNSPYGKAIIEI
jgi:hypothetical protein